MSLSRDFNWEEIKTYDYKDRVRAIKPRLQIIFQKFNLHYPIQVTLAVSTNPGDTLLLTIIGLDLLPRAPTWISSSSTNSYNSSSSSNSTHRPSKSNNNSSISNRCRTTCSSNRIKWIILFIFSNFPNIDISFFWKCLRCYSRFLES